MVRARTPTLMLDGEAILGLTSRSSRCISRARIMVAEESMESLMARYVAGDLQAFDAFYELVAPRVFKYLLSMTRDRERTEDLCQTTFLKLHRSRAGWIPGSPVLPWLIAIARNALFDDSLRAKNARGKVTATGDLPDVLDLAELDLPLNREMASVDLAEILAEAIAGLPVLQREALVLTKQSGLTQREAALALGTTETAVKLRVHRAYGTLRPILRKYWESDQ
jgi:RNA polymerase sigma-70 factor (ECF subfamily)